MMRGIEITKVAVAQCVEQREAGQFKTYRETALCGNEAIEKHVTPHSGYPLLVRKYTDYRLAIADQTDAGKLTYDEGQALIDTKGEALTKQAVQLEEDLSTRNMMINAQKSNPFSFSRCQFDIYGTPRCSAW